MQRPRDCTAEASHVAKSPRFCCCMCSRAGSVAQRMQCHAGVAMQWVLENELLQLLRRGRPDTTSLLWFCFYRAGMLENMCSPQRARIWFCCTWMQSLLDFKLQRLVLPLMQVLFQPYWKWKSDGRRILKEEISKLLIFYLPQINWNSLITLLTISRDILFLCISSGKMPKNGMWS